MDVKILTWLQDIKQSIDEIEEFLPTPKVFSVYQKELKTKKAVERNLEIIGEALGRILKADPEFNISNARKILSTRNRVIHSYDNISDELIWTIVNRDLPMLKAEVITILEGV